MRTLGRLMSGVAGAVLTIAAGAGAAQDWLPEVVEIPRGRFITGSDRAERDTAYALDERAYGRSITREQRWYERERERGVANTDAYAITVTPITNRQYAAFIEASGHPAPDVSRADWARYGFIHPFDRTRRHAWVGSRPPAGREDHPVVLVSHVDARVYARWLTRASGRVWRLPSELEWEKAARGLDGRYFPWGNDFDPERLNSHDAGPFDTTAVGAYPAGASPFRLFDAAGQVFEWTATLSRTGGAVVKGGSWDDKGCGVCRPAARHARPLAIKHILIGFRLVREPATRQRGRAAQADHGLRWFFSPVPVAGRLRGAAARDERALQ